MATQTFTLKAPGGLINLHASGTLTNSNSFAIEVDRQPVAAGATVNVGANTGDVLVYSRSADASGNVVVSISYTPFVPPSPIVGGSTGGGATTYTTVDPFARKYDPAVNYDFTGTFPTPPAAPLVDVGATLQTPVPHWQKGSGNLVGTFGASENVAFNNNALLDTSRTYRDGRFTVHLPKGVVQTGQYAHAVEMRRQSSGACYMMALETSSPLTSGVVVISAFKIAANGALTAIGQQQIVYGAVQDFSTVAWDFVCEAYTYEAQTSIRARCVDRVSGATVGEAFQYVDGQTELLNGGTWGVTSFTNGGSHAGSITIAGVTAEPLAVLPSVAVVSVMDSNGLGAETSQPGGATAVVQQTGLLLMSFAGPRHFDPANTSHSGSHCGGGADGWLPSATSGYLQGLVSAANGVATDQVVVMVCLFTNSAGNLNRIDAPTFVANHKTIIQYLIDNLTNKNLTVALFVGPYHSPLADNATQYYDAISQGLEAQYAASLDAIAAAFPGKAFVVDRSFTSISEAHVTNWYNNETTPAGAHHPQNGVYQLHLNDAGSAAWADLIAGGIARAKGWPNAA
jgi:hypothetical protein